MDVICVLLLTRPRRVNLYTTLCGCIYKANILEHYPRRLMAEMDDGKAFDIYN